MQYLGLDVGTQGTKGLVIDTEAGTIVARASVSYGLLETDAPGAAEQEPSQWLDAVRQVVAQLVSQAGVDPQAISGIGVSGQQHGLVVLDQDDQVIRPAKLWCDTETAPEAAELSKVYGHSLPAGFTASKVLWLKKNEPLHFDRTRSVLLPHDYINFWLTGEKAMEAGDASGTGFFDVESRGFDAAKMRAIDPALNERLPALIPAGSVVGALRAPLAAELGLRGGTPVGTGSGDNMMSAVGSGAIAEGVVVMSLGTSGTVFTYRERPVIDPDGAIAPFCDATGGYLPLLCVMNVTGVTEEVRRAFGMDVEELTHAASRCEPGAGGLLLLPYLQGERVPDLPDATGVLTGIRPGSLEPGKLFRAALEGTSLGLGFGVDRMRRLGVEVDTVRVVGGASRNSLWCQILADVLGAPVRAMAEPESAALGAAIHGAWCTNSQSSTGGDRASLQELAAPFLAETGTAALPCAEHADRTAELKAEFTRKVQELFGTAP